MSYCLQFKHRVVLHNGPNTDIRLKLRRFGFKSRFCLYLMDKALIPFGLQHCYLKMGVKNLYLHHTVMADETERMHAKIILSFKVLSSISTKSHS